MKIQKTMTYNPFKYLGTYVGTIIGLIFGLTRLRVKPNPNLSPGMTGTSLTLNPYIVVIMTLLGFVFGYVIHLILIKADTSRK